MLTTLRWVQIFLFFYFYDGSYANMQKSRIALYWQQKIIRSSGQIILLNEKLIIFFYHA